MPDTVTVEVISSRMIAASKEMFATLVRTAYSPNIRERQDCSTGVFDSRGRLIALSAIGPIHLSSLIGVTENLLGKYPINELSPGDCFITNDPYVGGGSHLPDITLISPVFHDKAVVAFVANLAHHSDVGGRVPGSESADCSDIFQEGIRIPMVRLVCNNKIQTDIVDFLSLNSRRPADREGDISAQIAANRTGVSRVTEIYAKFGGTTVGKSIEGLLDHAEKRVAKVIRQLPNGCYQNVDYLDNDGISDILVPLKVALHIDDHYITYDFSGSNNQVAGARNMPLNATLATVYYATKALLDPDLPANAGTYRRIQVVAPKGSVFNAAEPAAVGDRAATGNILGDLIFGAMAKADPSRVISGCGPYSGVIVSGIDPRTNVYFVDYETFAGASGASGKSDGHDAVRVHVSGSANLPIEALEHDYPIIVDCYELITESGGTGQYRGGLGTRRDIRLMGQKMRLSGRGLRHNQGAPALFGGGIGQTGQFTLSPDQPEEKPLSASFSDLEIPTGTKFRIETPSGAGYGSVDKRSLIAIRDDVSEGRQSLENAQSIYEFDSLENLNTED